MKRTLLVADVRTQADYQMMDEHFVGLIFAVFNEDKQTKVLQTTHKFGNACINVSKVFLI